MLKRTFLGATILVALFACFTNTYEAKAETYVSCQKQIFYAFGQMAVQSNLPQFSG